ncbi:MAG: hypothetical protein ACFNXE_04865, partial [Rothia dentocariosa]
TGRGAEHHVAHPALSAGYPMQGQPGVPAYAAPQNPYAVGAAAYGVPGTSGYSGALSTGPDNSEIRKYASIYLVRLGIVSALLALYAMGIISGINDTFDSCKGALDQDKCLSRERIVIVPGYILVTLIAAFPICNIFGWLAVKNNRHYLRVRVINIIGIVLSVLGAIGGVLVLRTTVENVVTWGHTVDKGALVSLVATVAPAVDLVFSIIFVVYSSRMKRGIYSPKNTYQP